MPTPETEATIIQLAFNSRAKAIWSAQSPALEIIDLPEDNSERSRIDSFVAVLNEQPGHLGPDRVCFAKIVRVNNRRIEFRFEPPEIKFAYRRWQGDGPTIIGHVDLWIETFIIEAE